MKLIKRAFYKLAKLYLNSVYGKTVRQWNYKDNHDFVYADTDSVQRSKSDRNEVNQHETY